MATILGMTFPRMLKTLRDNGNVKEKREVLTYISSQAKKLELSGTIKEERYKDLCKVIVEALTKHEGSLQNEALRALTVIVQEFKAHPLHLFEAMLQTDKRTRLKILKLLEVVDENTFTAVINDGQAVNFFKDCVQSVQPSLMEWIKPTACTDNLDLLTRVEQQSMSDEQKLEEDVINYSLSLLTRLYKLASQTFDNIHRFDELLLDKIDILAYMGHKRQRVPALRVLQQAVATNSSSYIRKEHSQVWVQYKSNLQSVYCKRMLLLVSACEADWALQWNTTIQFLGTDLHCGASFINNLLSVEEKAFKSTDPIIRRQAFLSWKLLIDNFALDHQELATPRRIKLLCIPLNAKNSKTELIALTKLEVWWHLIIKLYKDIEKFVTPVITQFLNYCFGPLGDTPLLSLKFDVVASPGKRFLKTKVVAVDALCQLVVKKEELSTVCAPMLEERLPHPISDVVFQECPKSIIHSIGEALLILGQLTDQEMKNSFQLGKKLWTSLMAYISNTKLVKKEHLYKDVILVVTELGSHTDKQIVKLMIFNVILPDIIKHVVNKVECHGNMLPELVLKLLSVSVFKEVPKLIPDYYNTMKCLLTRCISAKEFPHSKDFFNFLDAAIQNVTDLRHSPAINLSKTPTPVLNVWTLIAELVTKYITANSDISEHEKFIKTVKRLLLLPFQRWLSVDNHTELQAQISVWKALYKQFDSHPALKVQPNTIVLDVSSIMRNFLIGNKCCYTFIVNCLDVLLESLNYKYLLDQDEIPSVLQLVLDIITISFNDVQSTQPEVALKTLTSMLNAVYGHNAEKTILYLHRCKPVIELVLTSRISGLFKEVSNMWKCVVGIFKDLRQQLNRELLLSYKTIFVAAARHPSLDVRSATQSVLEIKDDLNSSVKSALEEIKETAEKPASLSRSDSGKKKQAEHAKEIRASGSFLNRKSAKNLAMSDKLSPKSDKVCLLSEPDSQDYVYIKTELKFDVNRLTEHQKEILKKKREDIPALYNDLSQSSSQNSQNLQEWFDIKARHINELDKGKADSEANKENKASDARTSEELTNMVARLVDNIVNNIHSGKSEERNVEDIVSTKQSKDSKESKKDASEMRVKHTDTPKQAGLPASAASSSKQTASEENEEEASTFASVAKKLDFESREEYPEEWPSSPSMLDAKRRRLSAIRASSFSRSEEAEREKDPTSVAQRTPREKDAQGRSGASAKQSSLDDGDVRDGEARRGVKRKSVSDTESDGSKLRKRKSAGVETPQSGDADANTDSLSQRTKNEISRLKIDMVFDCNSANRRRVKHLDDEREAAASAAKKPDPGTAKRRGRKPGSRQTSKDSSDVAGKSDDTGDRAPESETASDAGAATATTSSEEAEDVASTGNKVQERGADEESPEPDPSAEPAALPEPSEHARDDAEDVVESSQVPRVGSMLDKLCSEKQCFIKIKKVTSIPAKTPDAIAGGDYVPESTPMDYESDVPESSERANETDPKDNAETNDEETKDNASTDPAKETDHSSTRAVTGVAENQKTLDGLSSVKFPCTYSSPKSTGKVFSKSRSFTGRAAHMLGLVTKQSLIESDLTLDDESAAKRVRTTESETPAASKKISTVKEVDKIGGPSGSRQEKMFSNMRCAASGEYSASPSTHTFATLKNDGEKLSYRLEKIASDASSTEGDKDAERRVSPPREKSDLPILEWSSANPPSLTASPSASILKRQRSSASEPDADTTPGKRKRVSFADPPVSKEMGYETSGAESPQKPFKYSAAHSPTLRRDSPFRFKQSRLKPLDVERVTVENGAQSEGGTEVAERTESPIRTADASPEVATVDEQAPGNVAESDAVEVSFRAKIIVSENLECAQEVEVLAQEVEVLAHSVLSPEVEQQPSPPPGDSTSVADCVATEDPETQQDMFDTRNNTAPTCTDVDDDVTMENNSADPVKLGVTNDSVIAALPTKDDRPTSMEDTIDVANITGLTSVNTDEIFCEKLMRTSTQEAENTGEQDTVLATDSIFASLSSLSQEDENDAEPDPECLNSTQPIYPGLSSCGESIGSILGQLTYPSWTRMLGSYLENRSVRTVGELAQLSEREVNRLPLKSKSKISLVKEVLQHFESKSVPQARDGGSTSVEDASSSVATTEETTTATQVSDAEATSVTTETLNCCSTPLNRTESSEELLDGSPTKKSSVEQIDKTDSLTSDMEVSPEHVFVKSADDSPESKTLAEDTQTSAKVSTTAESSPGTCTDSAKSMSLSTFEDTDLDKEVPSTSASVDAPQVPRVYDELLITHSSIGTNTDEVNLSGPTVQKATRSVESQMALEELLDEIDVNLVLESAVRRCTPEALITHYKGKMGILSESELIKETLKMLCLQNTQRLNDASLRAACHACGLNKVLLRLPDIFSNDKQFFDKVLNVYSKKLNLDSCLSVFDFNEVKKTVSQRCTSSELVDMLSEKLKAEEKEGIRQPMPELSSLDAMLQRLPMDVIISHTVANEELIPASVVLDMALQNNSPADIAQALRQSPALAKHIFDGLWSSQFAVARIDNDEVSKRGLLNIFKSVSSKLTAQELLDAYYEAMSKKHLKNERE